MRQLFDKYKSLLGMLLLCLGVVLFTVAFLLGLTHYNVVTLSCLLLIIAGVVLHVVILKRQSKY